VRKVTVGDVLQPLARDFIYTLEQIFRGRKGGGREVSYHFVMKNMGWTWRELMETPYEVVVRTMIILSVENRMQEYERRRAEKCI